MRLSCITWGCRIMTCLVALKDKGHVYMGADSMVSGAFADVLAQPKVI